MHRHVRHTHTHSMYVILTLHHTLHATRALTVPGRTGHIGPNPPHRSTVQQARSSLARHCLLPRQPAQRCCHVSVLHCKPAHARARPCPDCRTLGQARSPVAQEHLGADLPPRRPLVHNAWPDAACFDNMQQRRAHGHADAGQRGRSPFAPRQPQRASPRQGLRAGVYRSVRLELGFR